MTPAGTAGVELLRNAAPGSAMREVIQIFPAKFACKDVYKHLVGQTLGYITMFCLTQNLIMRKTNSSIRTQWTATMMHSLRPLQKGNNGSWTSQRYSSLKPIGMKTATSNLWP